MPDCGMRAASIQAAGAPGPFRSAAWHLALGLIVLETDDPVDATSGSLPPLQALPRRSSGRRTVKVRVGLYDSHRVRRAMGAPSSACFTRSFDDHDDDRVVHHVEIGRVKNVPRS